MARISKAHESIRKDNRGNDQNRARAISLKSNVQESCVRGPLAVIDRFKSRMTSFEAQEEGMVVHNFKGHIEQGSRYKIRNRR